MSTVKELENQLREAKLQEQQAIKAYNDAEAKKLIGKVFKSARGKPGSQEGSWSIFKITHASVNQEDPTKVDYRSSRIYGARYVKSKYRGQQIEFGAEVRVSDSTSSIAEIGLWSVAGTEKEFDELYKFVVSTCNALYNLGVAGLKQDGAIKEDVVPEYDLDIPHLKLEPYEVNHLPSQYILPGNLYVLTTVSKQAALRALQDELNGLSRVAIYAQECDQGYLTHTNSTIRGLREKLNKV